jgi:hypothetical protein
MVGSKPDASLWVIALCSLALAGFALLAAAFSPSVRMNDRELRIRRLHRSVRLPWNSVTEIHFGDRPQLFVRAPGRKRLWPLPYDPEIGAYMLNLHTVREAELTTALTRFAGPRWRGGAGDVSAEHDERQETEAEAEPEPASVLDGRFAGWLPRTIALLSGLLIFLGSPLAVVLSAEPPWLSFAACVALAALGLCVAALLRVPLRLHLDEQGMELVAGSRREAIRWADVERVTVRRTKHDVLTPTSIAVWFKEGAAVPAPWRSGRCFRPWAGGVVVTDCSSSGTGLRAKPSAVRRSLARYAGPAFAADPLADAIDP